VPPQGRVRSDGATAIARPTVPAAVGAPALPMHNRVDGNRQLTFAFVLGDGLRSWRGDRTDKASGCRWRTIEAPAAQPALTGRAGLPLRSGALARRRSRRSFAPRPLQQRGPRPGRASAIPSGTAAEG
jgi:hypothetical protein